MYCVNDSDCNVNAFCNDNLKCQCNPGLVGVACVPRVSLITHPAAWAAAALALLVTVIFIMIWAAQVRRKCFTTRSLKHIFNFFFGGYYYFGDGSFNCKDGHRDASSLDSNSDSSVLSSCNCSPVSHGCNRDSYSCLTHTHTRDPSGHSFFDNEWRGGVFGGGAVRGAVCRGSGGSRSGGGVGDSPDRGHELDTFEQ
eukprot:GHVR01124527.1.p1 GENE.GHVR01124527.1~~GHVR01124527.1.p1  ORF type:complete len:206 (-),score=51.71 GHVR01124527.1:39-629(-)